MPPKNEPAKPDDKVVRLSTELWEKVMNGAPNALVWEHGFEGALRHQLKLPQLPKKARKSRAA